MQLNFWIDLFFTSLMNVLDEDMTNLSPPYSIFLHFSIHVQFDPPLDAIPTVRCLLLYHFVFVVLLSSSEEP